MIEITIIDVMRSSGVRKIDPKLSWKIGTEVAKLWRSANGSLPKKVLSTKTSGAGSHCLACYPETLKPIIRLVVDKHAGCSAKQIPLF